MNRIFTLLIALFVLTVSNAQTVYLIPVNNFSQPDGIGLKCGGNGLTYQSNPFYFSWTDTGMHPVISATLELYQTYNDYESLNGYPAITYLNSYTENSYTDNQTSCTGANVGTLTLTPSLYNVGGTNTIGIDNSNMPTYPGTFEFVNNPSWGTNIYAKVTVTYQCPVTYGTDTQTACDSFTWIDGNTYTTSNNTATHTLVGGNSQGCDSTVTLNLTMNYSNTGTDVLTACDSLIWIDGNTYTASNNTATWILPNVHGCDSVVTLNLTVNYSNTGTDVQTACQSYTWIDGNTYTASNNTATWTLTNTSGCDSVVTLNLTINNADNTVTQFNATTLVANATSAVYQWLDCNNSYSPLAGETYQSFVASTNGDYAVMVTENGCTDTSTCYTISNVGLEKLNSNDQPRLYPNPTSGKISIELGKVHTSLSITVHNTLGQEIINEEIQNADNYTLHIDGPAGIYFVTLRSPETGLTNFKVVKE